MEAHLNEFLDRHYFDPEPITTLLKKFGWHRLLYTRIHQIVETQNPDYSTIVASLIQPINDTLRRHSDLKEKKEVVDVLGELFRNLLAHFCENKHGFHQQLPDLVKGIKILYKMNGDDFEELDRLIGFDRFIYNLKYATPVVRDYNTRYLKWEHPIACLDHLCACMQKFGLVLPDSDFSELFRAMDKRIVYIQKKYKKLFTIVIGHLFREGMLRPVGGKSTYAFVEENVITDDGQPFRKGYMKRTFNNTNSLGVGYNKHWDTVHEFMRDLDQKSGL